MGGSEQILTMLDRALSQMGHLSAIVAVEGSRVSGELIPTPDWKGSLGPAARRAGAEQHRMVLERVCREREFDLVHMHSLDFHRYMPTSEIPVLATLHLPPDWYPEHIFTSPRPRTWLNCVSLSQQSECPNSALLLDVCPNGIEVHRFPLVLKKGSYALALGRVCPEKGYHLAMDAAKRAGRSLTLAGEVTSMPEHQEYFREEIVPRLDSRRRFLGPVGFAAKRRLLANAACLLIPSLVAETSSLVAMEALACGTPVVAFAMGALPEIIEHGRTGYLVRDPETMAESLDACRAVNPADCRASAEARFSADVMVRRYVRFYDRIRSSSRSDVFPAAYA